MLSYKYRFHGHGSLRYLYQNGQKIRTKDLSINYIKNSKRKNPRFAVVVSKKVYKSAVKRNRLRRRIYELIRHEIDSLSDTYDVAITVFSDEVNKKTHQELKKLLHNLLAKAGVVS